jgi:hypothetical protein
LGLKIISIDGKHAVVIFTGLTLLKVVRGLNQGGRLKNLHILEGEVFCLSKAAVAICLRSPT